MAPGFRRPASALRPWVRWFGPALLVEPVRMSPDPFPIHCLQKGGAQPDTHPVASPFGACGLTTNVYERSFGQMLLVAAYRPSQGARPSFVVGLASGSSDAQVWPTNPGRHDSSNPNTLKLGWHGCSLGVCLVLDGRSLCRSGGCRIWYRLAC